MSPKKPRDSQTVVILFAAGAALVVAALSIALARKWATFDPLVTASMIGIGLLLIVIYERLGHMHSELRTIAFHLERLGLERLGGAEDGSRSVQDGARDARPAVPDVK